MFKSLSDAVVGLCNKVFTDSSDGVTPGVVYTPNGGSPVTINGIFDNAYVDVEGIVSLKPTLRIKLSDLVALPGKGDTVLVNSTTYRIQESRPDAFGGSTLILQK